MIGLLRLVVLSILVAIGVALLCLLLGTVLDALNESIARSVGRFFVDYGEVIGVLCGLAYFFSNLSLP